jgi:peptidyl-prolyl cis-trans isomerase B (cyclophilin B)
MIPAMNKMQIIIFAILVVVFGGLFFAVQSNVAMKGNLTPTPDPLPTGSEYLRVISPNQSNGQQAQQQAPPTQAPVYGVEKEVSASMPATIKTNKGDIHIVLYGDIAPNTVRNFLNKAASGFYNNLTFHRVEDWVIQGGDPTGTGSGGGQIASELNDKPFVAGAIGLARTPASKEISNDSQFFIVKTDATHLNNDYVNFGMVTEGMDVVNKIQKGDKILSIIADE